MTIQGLNDADDAGIPDERRTVGLPTLFVNGDADYCTRAEVAGQIAQGGRLADVKLAVLPGSGHWIQLEKRDELGEILAGFADGL